MATHQIPEDQWTSFFEVFTERRKGAAVNVEVADPKRGPRMEVSDQSLEAITLSDGAVTVAFASGATHTVPDAKAVYHKTAAGIMSDEVNPDELVEITSGEDPPITLLHFTK
ncbi:MAG: DUF5335 family protein [Armatimonadetes bacterium]|nr:DUF5335 family protein [Armatimonadota bacterium]